MSSPRENYDAVIVGGGLAGLTAAVALAGNNVAVPLQVCVIDRADPEALRSPAFDGRASAITASSKKMLEALGVWETLASHAEPMREIIVTDSRPGADQRPALLHFGEEHTPGAVSAYMVENALMYAALFDAAMASPNIEVWPGSTVDQYKFERGQAVVTLAGGQEAGCQLLVAADGRNSATRAAAGIDTIGWSYAQTAITLTVEHELGHHGRAEEHFLPSGPFAILPLSGNRSSLVWTERTSDAEKILAMDDAAFLAELRSRFGSKLGAVRPVSRRFSYPLSLHIAHQFAKSRLALIGDAAHVVHPIAGLGFNLGLRDVAALAEVTMDAMRLGLDIGAIDVVERYQMWRRTDTVMAAVATDGINRLFSNDNPAIRTIRDMGLGMVNRTGGLKSAFMREASGLSGQLPKLLAGEPV